MDVVDRAEFLREAQLMKTMSQPGHENVIRLYGVRTQSEPLQIVMELANSGCALDYLRDVRRNWQTNGYCALSQLELIGMAHDTAAGMSYLNSKKHHFVHRDLAARNLLMHEAATKLSVKLSDFGLARDMHYLQRYQIRGEALLPVRWMSPEAILDNLLVLPLGVCS